ncbi:MAG: methyltransferase domain-containing protein [Candidatus Hydrogenedens sp.]|jgi:SAM-dependent methyltransferase|nr:methyltransferase domain-containing protein [Candidatus Hydrogenedens sp.]
MDSLEQHRKWSGEISNLANAFRKSQILFTALEAGVFDLLEEACTAKEIAHKLQYSERGISLLLGGLLSLELITLTGDRYQNTPKASACLKSGGDAYQGDILRHTMNGREAWAALPERVRTGTCPPAVRKRSGEALRNFILGMSNIALMSARECLQAVDLSGYRHMLDLAGGPGTYGITFQKQFPALRVTLFDRPDVVSIAKEQVEEAGLSHRFSFISGDCHVDDLGRGYDLAFLSNIIHSFGFDENARLVQRVHDALEPGGRLIIKDFILDNDRQGPAYGLMFALQMLVHTPAGNTYSFDEIQSWTDAAGFKGGESKALTAQTRLWIVQK